MTAPTVTEPTSPPAFQLPKLSDSQKIELLLFLLLLAHVPHVGPDWLQQAFDLLGVMSPVAYGGARAMRLL